MKSEPPISRPKPIKTTPLSIKLEPEKKELLTRIAQEKSRSVHFLLCQAVDEYLDREQKRLAFYEEARLAIAHYDQTALHTTQAEMRAWIESLGTANELAQPACHK